VNRRHFLTCASQAALLAHFPTRAVAETPTDSLNPAGIKVAGIKMVPVCGGRYKVWTKKLGSGPVKVLLLHGGPAFGHPYMEAMESFLPQAGIEMHYYDQLGCGNSDIPDEPSLWTLRRYTEEVEEVRSGLGLEKFVLLGHSWGGMLGLEYALHYQQHLRALVISNASAGIRSIVKRLSDLKIQLLSAEQLRTLNQLQSNREYDAPEYEQIVQGELYPKMICRLSPWPEPILRSLRLHNDKIYVQMQGKSEFEVTGNLKEWERWDQLQNIHVPTLTIGSRYDENDPADMKRMSELVKHGSYAYCPNGSHLCFWDDQAAYFRQLISYLRRV
jgi:proline iminopeptidase